MIAKLCLIFFRLADMNLPDWQKKTKDFPYLCICDN